jgi:hypothetical protein
MITKATIRNLVEDKFVVSLTKRTRQREFYYPRLVYFKLCREFTSDSLESIGRSLGYDHATVLNANSKFDIHTGMGYFKKYDSVYHTLFKYIQDNFITVKTEKKTEVKCVEDIQKIYRIKSFRMQDKFHRVISNMNVLKNSQVIQKIGELAPEDVREFEKLAENFYKRKRKTKQNRKLQSA